MASYLAERAARVAIAKAYPFPAPAESYAFVAGAAYPVVEAGQRPFADSLVRAGDETVPIESVLRRHGCRDERGLDGRVPVLAYGSNVSPEQLARKFAVHGSDVLIPVVRGWLTGFDVVYAPHFTRYGAIPATLVPAPATSVAIAMTYLTPRQLKRMHETEIAAVNYVYGELTDIVWTPGIGAPAERAFGYVTVHGALGIAGAPIALAPVAAERRGFDAMTKPAVLALARDVLVPGMDLDDFIDDVVRVAHVRAARTRALRETALPIAVPGLRIIEA